MLYEKVSARDKKAKVHCVNSIGYFAAVGYVSPQMI